MIESAFDSAIFRFSSSPASAPGPSGRLPSDRAACCASGRPAICSAGRRTRAWAGRHATLTGGNYLILSTHGGVRAPDGTPVALGYHTGHWEVGLLGGRSRSHDRAHGRDSVCGGVHRSVRRPHRRARRHVRQPALSQRCGWHISPIDSISADAPGSPRHRDLRQGTARDDDGPRRDARSALRSGPGRSHVAPQRRRGRGTSANHRRCASRMANSRWQRLRSSAAARAEAPAEGVSFWGQRRHRRWSAKRSDYRSDTRRWRLQDNRSGSTWLGARREALLKLSSHHGRTARCARRCTTRW